MLRRKTTKSECERMHVKRRFLERFGIELSRKKRLQIIDEIQSGRATFIEKESTRVSLFDVSIEHQVVRVAYDRLRKELITAMVPSIVALDEDETSPTVPNSVLSDPFWDEFKKKMLESEKTEKRLDTEKDKIDKKNEKEKLTSQNQQTSDLFWQEYVNKMISGQVYKIEFKERPKRKSFWDEYKDKMSNNQLVLKT